MQCVCIVSQVQGKVYILVYQPVFIFHRISLLSTFYKPETEGLNKLAKFASNKLVKADE